MTTTLLTGIVELVTNDPAHGGPLGVVPDAAVVVEGDRVAWVGPAAHAPAADEARDLGGRAVIPGFVDSHAHLVFAGERSGEFAARMAGVPYDGGGIATTVAATRAAGDDELRTLLAARIAEMRAQGTTTVEVKSGYGLTVADEVRALRLAREVTEETTYLGAHVVPAGAEREQYVRLVAGEMLAACAPYARWAPPPGRSFGLGGAKLLYRATNFNGAGFLPGFDVTTETLLLGAGVALVLMLASGLVPAVRAARLPVVQALRRVE